MVNMSKDMREMLKQHFTIARPEIVEEQVSNDGTRKWLLRFPPRGAGRPVDIETVYIPEEGRGTLCISSQVGCTLTCSFCHTGTQRLVRNLTAEEILSQLLLARDRLGDFPDREAPQGTVMPAEGRKVSNIVMMGMGEPLYNFDAVKQALLIATDGDGCLCRSAASPCRPPASCRRFSAPATRSASCWRSRCMPCATTCATCSCRSTRSIR
jgi:23S rRNA (adenine2503-C2)-methyltransferase